MKDKPLRTCHKDLGKKEWFNQNQVPKVKEQRYKRIQSERRLILSTQVRFCPYNSMKVKDNIECKKNML